MKSLVDYLNCGNYIAKSGQNMGEYIAQGLSDNVKKIIPFFNKYKIEGAKALDYADFCKVAVLMTNKEHLTEEGLAKIQTIKSGMNTGRQMSTWARPHLYQVRKTLGSILQRGLHTASTVKNNSPANSAPLPEGGGRIAPPEGGANSKKDNFNKKLVPIKKHFPASTREWANSVYMFNSKRTILLSAIDKMVTKLIKIYFNAYPIADRMNK